MFVRLALLALVPAHTDALSIRAQGPLDSCGKLASYKNAKPKNYKDAMATKFNTKTKKQEAVTFQKGDKVDFKCLPGFTTDGSKDGKTVFTVTCSNMGYFKPGGVCVEASKCGAVPAIPHATATPNAVRIEDT